MVPSAEPLLYPQRHGLVVVLAAPEELAAQLAALHPAERAVAATLSPIRQREWVAGRTALREALRREALLGDEPLLRDDRGAPQLPAVAAGSLSHKGSWAAALVAPRQDGRSIGVDLEDARGPRLDISRKILTERELAAFAALPDERRNPELALRFSLKEAVYKAIDPWVRRYVGFREVELVLDAADGSDASAGSSAGTGRVTLVSPQLVAELGRCEVEVGWTRLPSQHWLSTARALR